jgi:hypothetical protein
MIRGEVLRDRVLVVRGNSEGLLFFGEPPSCCCCRRLATHWVGGGGEEESCFVCRGHLGAARREGDLVVPLRREAP